MTFGGCDPGQKGAFSIIDAYGKVLEIHHMPDNPQRIWELLQYYKTTYPDLIFGVEKAASRPGTAVKAISSYHRHNGHLEMALIGLKIQHEFIPPAVWCKKMHAGADMSRDVTAKQRSSQIARRLFPETNFKANPRCRKDHDGVMDSLLIAYYMRLKHGKRIQDI